MTKKYIIAKIEEKEKEIFSGYDKTVKTIYKLTYTGYSMKYDTEEEALLEIENECGRYEMWTILPVYVEDVDS